MDYRQISKETRKKILKMMYESHTAHLSGCLSCVDILTFLYFKILKINPKKPFAENRDRFILSKGHGVAALYATLAQKGFFSEKVLSSYCRNEGLPGHSTRGYITGVELSTGSLGYGLSTGAGMALAAKRDGKKYRVFVLMSDGECEEGSTWEAALFAAHHKLDNLIGIVDYNKLQAFGRIKEVLNLEPFLQKWRDFGWQAKEINGHNFSEIKKAFSRIPFKKGKPSLVLAHTVKGKGVSFIEDKMEWHYKNLTKEQYELALKEVEEKEIK